MYKHTHTQTCIYIYIHKAHAAVWSARFRNKHAQIEATSSEPPPSGFGRRSLFCTMSFGLPHFSRLSPKNQIYKLTTSHKNGPNPKSFKSRNSGSEFSVAPNILTVILQLNYRGKEACGRGCSEAIHVWLVLKVEQTETIETHMGIPPNKSKKSAKTIVSHEIRQDLFCGHPSGNPGTLLAREGKLIGWFGTQHLHVLFRPLGKINNNSSSEIIDSL